MAEEAKVTLDTAATPDVAPNQGATPTPDKADQATPEKQAEFTQADVDRIIADRLKRERDKYADYNDLRKAADELAKLREAELSETEKLQKKLAEAEAKAQQAELNARSRSFSAAVIAAAARLNFNDPSDAVALLKIDAFEFDENGQPVGVDEKVKELAAERKYLIKSKGGSLEPFEPAQQGGPVRETDAQKRARLYGGGDFWNNPGGQGGGVVWPKGPPDKNLPGG